MMPRALVEFPFATKIADCALDGRVTMASVREKSVMALLKKKILTAAGAAAAS